MTSSLSLASNIRNILGVVRRRRILIAAVFLVLMTGSIVVIAKMPRTYVAGANVLIVNGTARNDPTLSSVDLPDIVGGTDVLERVQRKLGISIPLLTLKKHVKAKPPAYRSGIMRIEYTDTDRDRAALIVNGIADELASYYTTLSTARYDQDLRALGAELLAQKSRLESIDAQLRADGGANLAGSDGSTQDTDSSDSALDKVESQRALAYADLQGDIAQEQATTADARQDILLADPLYQQLESSLTKASAELADARSRYTADYPGLSDMETRVDSLKGAVAHEADRALSSARSLNPNAEIASPEELKARAAVEADRAKVAALDQELAVENKDQSVAGPAEVLLLERQQVLHEYQSIAARRATSLADRADALSLGSVEVVDRAIPSEEQTGPGPIRLAVIAAFITLILAFGSAFLADQLDPSLHGVTQIEGLYGKRLIATLRTSHSDTK